MITTISAYIIYKVTLPFYPFIDKFLFWSVNLLPHFLIWSGIASGVSLIYTSSQSVYVLIA